LENKGLGCRFFRHFSAVKESSGFCGVAICASDLQDKELEFFHKRFLKMNYWGKVGILIFEKTMWGAKYKLLHK
jgi:hypothetical protein